MALFGSSWKDDDDEISFLSHWNDENEDYKPKIINQDSYRLTDVKLLFLKSLTKLKSKLDERTN